MKAIFSIIVLWVFCVAVLKFSSAYLHKTDLSNASDYIFMAGAVLLIGSLMIRGLRNYNLSQKKPQTILITRTHEDQT